MKNGDRGFWLALIPLVVVGILLGVRTEQSVGMVLATRPGGASLQQNAQAQNDRAMLAVLDAKAERVAQATLGARDPLRDPPAPPAPPGDARRPVTPPPPVKAPPPALRAMMYADVNSSVQLESDGASSEWLHEGDSFKGWKIVQITPGSVKVSRGGETQTLTLQSIGGDE